ncbi:glycosyltransferase family 4 protein [Arthrobacter sp. PvP103]|uniref:glycosyltransferase family 4 protein n=1 Tax=Arthrobacter sp. PvP103 TaxID=2806593 RepID=UPI001AE74627|nr:glycosyltransferase family 4 protein [Arthrobacter sp. PvP103]
MTSQWPALLLLADAGVESDIHIAHNVDTVISRSHDPAQFRWLGNSHRMEIKEREILRLPKSVLAISKSDTDRIRKWGVPCRHLTIAPRNFNERPPSSTVIGFIGKATWPPNAQAIRILVDEVLPKVREKIPTANVVLSGRETEKWSDSDGVTSLGRIDQLSDFYDLADLVVVPRLGESTGVSVKMLEAVTFGRPVVAPSILASDAGLDQGVIKADDVNATVDAIVEYFRSGGRRDVSAGDHASASFDNLKLDELESFMQTQTYTQTLRTSNGPATI